MISLRTFRIGRALALALVAGLVVACSDSTPSLVLTTLTVTLSTPSIQSGTTTTATVVGVDQNGGSISTGTVTWTTGSAAVATVNASGIVSAVAPGTTQVIATSGGKSGQATITVTAPPPVLTTINVAAPLVSITFGQTTTATAAGVDQYNAAIATGTVAWSSSAPTIASVNATSGLVTGLAAGTATITATAGGKTGTRAVTVVAPAPLVVNEVESNGGTPGDWIEIYNPTNAAVDISGWGFRDNDSTHVIAKVPAGTSIPAGGYYIAEESFLGFGLGAADDARLYNPFNVVVDSYTWTAHAAITYGRCPNGTGAFVNMNTVTKSSTNDCRPAVKINEVESNGGTPGDWIELYNAGTTTVNLAGFIVRDNDDTHNTVLSAGTTIAPGAFLVIEEATLGYGLGSADAARLFDPNNVLVDSYEWTAHAAITYGRCPDGTGAFASTTASTKGAANQCAPVGPTDNVWPGSDNVTTIDGLNVFTSNLSGLAYEGAAAGRPAVIWAAKNGVGSIYRLIFSGGIWTPDPTNGWATGKPVKYPDGSGEPDSEGITFAGGGSAAGLYISSERNNGDNGVSKNAILRYDPSAAGATLVATNQWDITADLPVVGPNLGIEAITWIPDSMLVANGFIDESKNRAYAPADYADHNGGLFFVGVEANGIIYAYALNHTTNGFTRVATISSGFPGVMDLAYDRESGYLWAICDDGCGNTTGIFTLDNAPGSATRGKFIGPRRYARPTTMPNINNEGFTFAPNSECVSNRKPVFWSDDSETNGHSLRTATIPCGTFAPLVLQGPRAITRRP